MSEEWPKIFEFHSKTDPNRTPYQTRLFEDGVIICECPGFINHNKCWHIETVKSKPVGYRDPTIPLADKHDIREAVAEGCDEIAIEIVFKIFPSITRDEAVDLVDQICNEVSL